MNKAKWILILMGIGLLSVVGCSREYLMTGETMGTIYHIKVVAGPLKKTARIQEKIDARLEQINQSMSTYRPDSEIRRFNALTDPDQPMAVSDDFQHVITAAREIYRITQGAWDGTVDPLVNLWGFGKDGMPAQVPSDDAIEAARQRVGFDRIDLTGSGQLAKKDGTVSLDLASIAKGYGVDQVSALLFDLGYKDFLVEIGGEVYAAGRRPDGKAWRVGINQPSSQAGVQDVYAVLDLENQAMATSGDYRNFYRSGDRTFSHIIDPRTGRPVSNGVVSASVIADNCTVADGLATALMVMGPERGINLLNQLANVQGVIIVRHPDGSLENFPSDGLGQMAQ